MLITPEKLEYGKGYSLVEVSAPYGYVLNSDPVYFDITEENSTEDVYKRQADTPSSRSRAGKAASCSSLSTCSSARTAKPIAI